MWPLIIISGMWSDLVSISVEQFNLINMCWIFFMCWWNTNVHDTVAVWPSILSQSRETQLNQWFPFWEELLRDSGWSLPGKTCIRKVSRMKLEPPWSQCDPERDWSCRGLSNKDLPYLTPKLETLLDQAHLALKFEYSD